MTIKLLTEKAYFQLIDSGKSCILIIVRFIRHIVGTQDLEISLNKLCYLESVTFL